MATPIGHRSRWPARLLGLVLAVASLASVVPGTAGASPVDDKRAEARRIAVERERLTTEAERLNEQAKKVQDQLDTLAATVADTDRRLTAQRQATSDVRQQAAQLAINAYVRGDVAGGLGAALGEDGATELQLHRGYAPVALGGGADLLDEARAAQQDTEALASLLADQRAQQQKLQATLTERTAAVATAQTKLVAASRTVDAELTQLVAEEQDRIAAEAEAAAAAKEQARLAEDAKKAAAERARVAALATTAPAAAPATVAPRATTPASAAKAAGAAVSAGSAAPAPATTRPPTSSAARPAAATATTSPKQATPRATSPPATQTPAPAPVVEVPPTSPAAAVAVAAALAQLGKPYVFNTNGPDTFDCSGLTQWAWAKAGVAMPHYTGSQWAAFPQVPVDQMQPGDLIFFNVSLGHVAMYIGNGQYVHAPHTGDVVRISSLGTRRIVGAVRPG